MFSSKEIYLFKKYYIDQDEPKHKFGIVLHENGEFIVTLIITSSQNHYNLNGDYGCHNKKLGGGIEHCFCFPKNKTICINGFSFSKDTYLYTVRSVQEKQKASLFRNDCVSKGVLTDEVYYDLLYCLMHCENIAIKYTELFEQLYEKYMESQ
jgi:hypothetical protein